MQRRHHWKGLYWRLKFRRHKHPFNQLMPIAEYAKKEHMSVNGIMHRINDGKLDAYKIGHRWYIVLDKPIEPDSSGS